MGRYTNIPNSYFINETFNIGGKILNNTNNINILNLIIDFPSGKVVNLKKDNITKYFLYSMPLDEVGEYKIKFMNNSQYSENFSIFVFDKKIFNNKKLFDENISAIKDIKIDNEHIAADFEAYRIRIGTDNLNEVILTQGDKKYEFYGIGDVVFFKESLRGFDLSKPIKLEILSSKTLTGFSQDYYSNFYKIFSTNFILQ